MPKARSADDLSVQLDWPHGQTPDSPSAGRRRVAPRNGTAGAGPDLGQVVERLDALIRHVQALTEQVEALARAQSGNPNSSGSPARAASGSAGRGTRRRATS